MEFKIVDIQQDKNLKCYSILTVVRIHYFIEFVNPIHEEKGNIDEQREVLQTRSAKIIRNQMVEDLKKGGILPPIVLGSICKEEIDENNFYMFIKNNNDIIILDGMQRIQALKDAAKNSDINHDLRVEFWFAQDEETLVYRMLVLNSGQIPWGIDKQLAVVFKPILQKLEKTIYNLEYLIKNKKYKQAEIVELFLSFTSRKVRIDKRQQLAEYHAALDIMSLIREKSGHIIDKFENILKLMIEIDELFSKIENRYVFNNQTVRIGFMVACAEKTFGLLGSNTQKDHELVENDFGKIISKLSDIILQVSSQDIDERRYFLRLDILEEKLRSIPKEKHRQAFLDGFKVIFSEDEINSFGVCWYKMD